MKTTSKSQSHTKSKKTNKQDYLIEYEQIENTPFTVVKREEENDETNYYVMFGKYRISEAIKNQEEARANARELDWWKIMSVAHAIAEQIIDQKELEKHQGKNEVVQNN